MENRIIVKPLTPITFTKPLKMQNSKVDTIIELNNGELLFVDSKTYDLDEIISWYNYTNRKD